MDYTFKEFFAIWSDRMRWKIPRVHMEIIDFVDNEENWDNKTKTLLLWRGVGKSTLTDLWIAYMLSKDPTLRFLILSADKTTAKRTSKDVLFIIRTHPLCKHLITNELEVQQDRFYVKGSKDPRNPSVSAYGILSNVTSARADYIVFDDVEVKKNSGDDTKREDLRVRIAEANNLLNPDIGRRLFIGTYHDVQSIYDEEISNGSALLRVPLMTNIQGEFPYITGDSQWPERFNDETIDGIQRNAHSRAEFLSQYLLKPTTVSDTLLDVSLLQQYGDELSVKQVNRQTRAVLGDFKITSCSAWWDPSLSKKRRDDSVLAIIYQDHVGNLFIHRVFKLEGEAEEQCKQIRKHVLEFACPVVSVEINGVGAFLPPILRKALRGTDVAVDDQFTRQQKREKIIEAFETPLSAGILFAHESVFNTPFLSQLRDYNNHYKGKDDFIDAAASAIKREPVRIGNVQNALQKFMKDPVQKWMEDNDGEIQCDFAKAF